MGEWIAVVLKVGLGVQVIYCWMSIYTRWLPPYRVKGCQCNISNTIKTIHPFQSVSFTVNPYIRIYHQLHNATFQGQWIFMMLYLYSHNRFPFWWFVWFRETRSLQQTQLLSWVGIVSDAYCIRRLFATVYQDTNCQTEQSCRWFLYPYSKFHTFWKQPVQASKPA